MKKRRGLRLIIPVLALLFTMSESCKKADNTEGISGKFMETSPASGRSYLDFLSQDRVVRTERGGVIADTFIYSLTDTTITLQPAWTNNYKVYPIYFRRLSSRAFEIEYMYATIGMAQNKPMVFERY